MLSEQCSYHDLTSLVHSSHHPPGYTIRCPGIERSLSFSSHNPNRPHLTPPPKTRPHFRLPRSESGSSERPGSPLYLSHFFSFSFWAFMYKSDRRSRSRQRSDYSRIDGGHSRPAGSVLQPGKRLPLGEVWLETT
ncbi:hypothetical protein BO70DRAFT_72554 [Aspergillus heteromorphus CBS 117.55]|uniref:Uncharacterized protein n=1 Tax=Aspergillus heteromorphus CBS 117.55 TaxID=1448321 RepID=A0A317VT50_9EURO|nr:uncharacterized protein BO70DRAFT_72554 [Aspergillus heteromorphus CBS 117.55]PWY77095.1 hypothetical protein BO70DRAFT_72554 [Aspergillus heteromorphus CBS 117.55]